LGQFSCFQIFFVALAFIAFNAHAARVYTGFVSYVTDGDTLWVQPDAGGPARKLRIEGIDSPEICQLGGEASREVLVQRALNQHVVVTVKRNDVYGRGLARIQLNGGDVGAMMVRSGQAWSYRWHRSLGLYAAEEADARQARRGLFAASLPMEPRIFRKRHGSCHVGY